MVAAGACRESQAMQAAPKWSLVLPSSSHVGGGLIRYCHTLVPVVWVYTPCKFLSSLISLYLPCLGYPGEGPVDILSINVTSLRKRRQDLIHIQDIVDPTNCVQCVCLQETRIPASALKSLQAEFDQHGWELHVGFQPKFKTIKTGAAALRQGHGGLATMTRKGSRARAVDFQEEWQFLHEYCQVLWCPSGSGSDGFFLVNVYLPPHAHNRDSRAEIVANIFHMVAMFRSPTCICGDFQDPPYSNPSIAEALCKGGWTDVHHELAVAKGVLAGFTFCGRKDGWADSNPKSKTRIDLFLVSPTFLPLLQDARVVYSAPFPGHAVVSISINLEQVHAEAFTLVPHQQWTLPHAPCSEDEWDDRESRCLPILLKHSETLISYVQNCDSEGLWTQACAVATEMLNCLSLGQVPPTRGAPPKFKIKKLSQTHTSPHSDSARLVKLKRRIHEASIQNSRFQAQLPVNTAVFCTTLDNICSSLASFGFTLLGPLPPRGTSDLETWLCSAMQFCETRQAKDLREADISKLNSWKARMKTSSAADRRQVHRWIKDESPSYPRCFKRPDGTITSNPQEMLDMVSDRMEAIYNTHKFKNLGETVSLFREKYAAAIETLKFPIDCPSFTQHDLFRVIQKRPSYKASGLDGWLTAELKCLPPSGWYPFMLVMKLAETTGVWPRVVRLVSVSTISKGMGNFDPSLMRAIGVSSVVYSTWSSLRFRQLTPWHLQIAPPSLYGGLQRRKAADSELMFSTDMQQSEEGFLAVLIDRYKCFDLIIPSVALEIALSLGLPQPIFKAACGFYVNQVKFFKLGPFFGRRVMSTNAAVQGCSLSILMVNAMYSVLAQHISSLTPDVQFASFVDDCKMWTIDQNPEQLKRAFSELNDFDECIGQSINDDKSVVLTKYQKRAVRFLRDVGRNFKSKKTVKSLGFSHTVGKRKNAKFQDQRVVKAVKTAARVAALPLSERERALHVHSNVHSQWVYGTEIQPPSRHQFRRLRTAIVRVFHKRRNAMRCPFHFMATCCDVFMDPWAKWVIHNLKWLRSEFWRNKQTLEADLVEVRHRMREGQAYNFDPTVGGRVNILGHIFKELRWQISEHDVFLVHRESDTDLFLVQGSNKAFSIEVARSVRAWLLRQAANRQDFAKTHETKHIDIFLTRFLLDTTFAERRDMEVLQSFLNRLPKPIERARAIAKALFEGSVFTGKRLCAAGIAQSDKCSTCHCPEDHAHLFQSCKQYQDTRPTKHSIQSMPSDSWHSGIIFESQRAQELRSRAQSPPVFSHETPCYPVLCSLAFVDGSCFRERWHLLSSGASAVVFENGMTVTQELPGMFASSQRAEIWAVVLALRFSCGSIRIGSDCACVVNTFTWLAANRWEHALLASVDNADLWKVVIGLIENRPNDQIVCFKVKAHVSGTSPIQPQQWTDLNNKADTLAKRAARDLHMARLALFEDEIRDAVELQSHLVSTLWHRYDILNKLISHDLPPQNQNFQSSCALRIRGKQKPQ